MKTLALIGVVTGLIGAAAWAASGSVAGLVVCCLTTLANLAFWIAAR